MLRHPEEEEMALEWVVFCNRDTFFIISFYELKFDKSAGAIAMTRRVVLTCKLLPCIFQRYITPSSPVENLPPLWQLT